MDTKILAEILAKTFCLGLLKAEMWKKSFVQKLKTFSVQQGFQLKFWYQSDTNTMVYKL